MIFPSWRPLSGSDSPAATLSTTPLSSPEPAWPSLVAQMPVAVVVVRTDGTLRLSNAAADDLFGATLGDGRDTFAWIDGVHADDRDALLRLLSDPAPAAPVELRIVRGDGEVRFTSAHALPDGGTIGLVFVDVTDQSATVAALHHSELLYSTFLEQSPVGMIHVDAAGTVTFENHRFRQIVGEGPDDAWIGLPVAQRPGTDAAFRTATDDVLAGAIVEGRDAVYAPADRPRRHLRLHGSPIRQADGTLVGAVLMVQDVTAEVNQAEEAALVERFGRAETALQNLVLTTSSEAALLGETARLVADALGATRVGVFLPDDTDLDQLVPRARWGTHADGFLHQRLRLTDDVIDEAVRHRAVAFLPATRAAAQRLAVPFFEAGVVAGALLLESVAGEPPLLAGPRERLLLGFVRLFETLRSWFISTDRFHLTVAAIEDCLFTYALELRAPRRYLLLTPQIARIAGIPAATFLDHVGTWEEILDGPESTAALAEHTARLGRGLDSEAVYRLRRPDGTVRVVRERATPQRTDGGLPRAAGILSDITEQAAAEQALLEAKLNAERSDRDKSAFIHALSHELRTPLGTLSGFADLLELELADSPDPETLAEFTSTIRAKARQTLALVNDLFDLTQLEHSALDLARTPVALDALARAAAEHAFDGRPTPEVQMQLDLQPVVAFGDPERLTQVLGNLLSNAFKFTPEGHVEVETRREDAHAVLLVRDTGIGISPEYRQRLFTPFVQEDQRLNRTYGGTGLGLALVKQLVDRMDGTIDVESAKGRGTTFTVRLPVADDATDALNGAVALRASPRAPRFG